MEEIVTYLEMTAREQLDPADPVPGLTLEPLHRDSPLVIELQVRIGTPYGWRCASRTEADWAAWFARYPDRMFWLLSFEGEPVGLVAYDLHPGDEVEIETFGLVPEFVGRRLGGYALTLGIQRAWDLTPTVRRLWLHTSSMDHPRALPNYHRRGFRTFRTETGDRA
ncbi:GNAT family N-acetyltransferase [Plantactinospora sp. B6F1]|uniref:GNAT family N-acetyltransferase n=1 Tax=Plantactinospora sp. B6F1 TaxID=3158971 RepID=UPI0032D97316